MYCVDSGMDYSEIDRLMASPESSDRRRAAAILGESSGEDSVERLVTLLRDANSGVRDAAYNALMFMGGKSAVARVAPLVAETDPGLRNAAIDILRAIGEDGLDVLHGLALHENDDIRLFVLDILGTIGNPASVEVLIGGLADPNPNVRNAAVVSLGIIADPRAFEPLARLIDDEEWIRFSVIEAMSNLDHEALAPFLMAQIERFKEDELTMTALLDAVGRTGCREAAARLLSLLEQIPRCVESDAALAVLRILGPEDLLKLGADEAGTLKSVIETHLMHAEGELLELMIGALSRIGDDRSARCLAGLARLVDPDVHPETFQAIENALAHIQATEVAGELLDGEEKLAVLGARVLERIGGRRAAELVQSRLSQVQGHVRRAFVEALASIDVVGYRDTFKALLKDPDGHVVRSCLVALGRAGDPGDVDDMSRYLVHEYPDVREAALQGMVSIGTGRVQQVFVEMCGDPDPRRRLVGLAGLARVGSPHLGEIVRVFLGDPDAEVRLRAVNAARDASLMIEAGVLARLLEDEDEGVRYAAVELVGLGRAEDLRGKLEEIAAGEDLRAASIAIESLANFRDDAALGTLLEFMARGPDLLRITAIRALGNWGREDLVPRIEPYQDDANPDVVRSAMDAVDRLQGVRF